MNQLHVRSFPRYDVNKFNFKLETSGERGQLINIGLGGLCIQTASKFNIGTFNNLKIEFGKQVFSLKGKVIWLMSTTISGLEQYRSGWSISFTQEEEFVRWLTLMKALDQKSKKEKE